MMFSVNVLISLTTGEIRLKIRKGSFLLMLSCTASSCLQSTGENRFDVDPPVSGLLRPEIPHGGVDPAGQVVSRSPSQVAPRAGRVDRRAA